MKPSKAITAIDAQIYATAFKSSLKKSPFGEVWSTYSEIDGNTFGIVLAADMKGDFTITQNNCGFNVNVRTNNYLIVTEIMFIVFRMILSFGNMVIMIMYIRLKALKLFN